MSPSTLGKDENTWHRIILNELGSPKNFTFLYGQRESKSWLGLTWELFLTPLSRNLNSFQKTVTRVPSLSQPPESLRSLDASNQMVQNSRRKCQPYITSYFQSRNRKWNPQHCFPLFLNKHAPCLDICLPQAKEWTCSVCVIARPYLWRSPQWVDTESPPWPPDIYLSETSENAETFSLLTALPGWDVRHWWQSRER